MDHIGVVVRRESAKLILAKIKMMSDKKVPVILTGDFNVDQHDESYSLLNTSVVLRDASELAPVKWAPTSTFNNFDLKHAGDSRIDHIFLDKNFKALRYGILNNTYLSQSTKSGVGLEQRLPSDHFPVVAVVEY